MQKQEQQMKIEFDVDDHVQVYIYIYIMWVLMLRNVLVALSGDYVKGSTAPLPQPRSPRPGVK